MQSSKDVKVISLPTALHPIPNSETIARSIFFRPPKHYILNFVVLIPLPRAQSLQSGLVPLPLLGHRRLREGPRGRRREGAVVGAFLAAGQDVLRGVPPAPAAHLSRNVVVLSCRPTFGLLAGDSKLEWFDIADG